MKDIAYHRSAQTCEEQLARIVHAATEFKDICMQLRRATRMFANEADVFATMSCVATSCSEADVSRVDVMVTMPHCTGTCFEVDEHGINVWATSCGTGTCFEVDTQGANVSATMSCGAVFGADKLATFFTLSSSDHTSSKYSLSELEMLKFGSLSESFTVVEDDKSHQGCEGCATHKQKYRTVISLPFCTCFLTGPAWSWCKPSVAAAVVSTDELTNIVRCFVVCAVRGQYFGFKGSRPLSYSIPASWFWCVGEDGPSGVPSEDDLGEYMEYPTMGIMRYQNGLLWAVKASMVFYILTIGEPPHPSRPDILDRRLCCLVPAGERVRTLLPRGPGMPS
ncbi:hypothetical protein PR048_017355 [Dryococelus australis]|uniref:Uncharacterized protein n=1 Tax=Dryococelus australis TaxID=614101 RepID=A0ABQ9H9C1_9NEOP|nr:hypothetical protein PR048_017355 [Dryococelus australis]